MGHVDRTEKAHEMESKATKPRSQKRERQGRAICFVNAAEKAAIEEKAARAGLSVSGYLRALIFGKNSPQPRGARRPMVEKELLVRLLGELGKIGSNVNQIAHVANQGRGVNYPALSQLAADVVEMRQQVKAVLGRELPERADEPPSVADAVLPTPKEEAEPPPTLESTPAPLLPKPVKGRSFFGKIFGGDR